MKPRSDIDVCKVSHRRLVVDVAALSATELGAPSLLPGYTRGHVVAHLTNKARAHALLFEGATAGEMRWLHPIDHDPDAAAAAGADRQPGELLSELDQALEQLEAAWDALDDPLWERLGLMMAGPRTMTQILGHHLRNVEVHHLDLNVGYRPSDWPERFVEGELVKRLDALPARADHAELLAWLLGRGAAPDLAPW